ncbi:hypothetical protein CN918_31095 [Priestia megaterium]|nr:hypothetical protein CN918_31095 [Priestia megaterium]
MTKKKKPLIVPDTNVYINAIFGKGKFKDDMSILDLEGKGLIQFASSENSQNELLKIASREVHTQNIYQCRDLLLPIYEIINRSKFVAKPLKVEKLSSTKDDQFFLDLAVHVKADYLITSDTRNNLLNVGEHRGVRIVRPAEFLRQYRKYMKA